MYKLYSDNYCICVCVVLPIVPIVDERQFSHREETEALQLGEERCHVNSGSGNTITADNDKVTSKYVKWDP